MPANDIALFAKWSRDRDAEAFKEIASRYAPMVYGTCNRILRDGSEAEDAAQECFAKLAFSPKGPKEHLGAWLHAVATTSCLAIVRSEKRRKVRESQFALEHSPDAAIQWDDVSSHIDEVIADLPERLRVPIVLHFFEDETHDAIARRLGVSRTTVTYRIQKAIELIRKRLQRRGLVVVGSALAAMMTANLTAEAAPKALTVALAKVAL
ncbi:MAG: sigma-70 family RNA polymerase sigma factor, partial [Candidatus Hydrogenedentales bacterium]